MLDSWDDALCFIGLGSTSHRLCIVIGASLPNGRTITATTSTTRIHPQRVLDDWRETERTSVAPQARSEAGVEAGVGEIRLVLRLAARATVKKDIQEGGIENAHRGLYSFTGAHVPAL